MQTMPATFTAEKYIKMKMWKRPYIYFNIQNIMLARCVKTYSTNKETTNKKCCGQKQRTRVKDFSLLRFFFLSYSAPQHHVKV